MRPTSTVTYSAASLRADVAGLSHSSGNRGGRAFGQLGRLAGTVGRLWERPPCRGPLERALGGPDFRGSPVWLDG